MQTALSVGQGWFEQHRATLEGALAAIRSREFWAAYPEVPSGKVYGETAADEGRAAFEARLHVPFQLDQPGTIGWVAPERSPYGIELSISYPKMDLDVLLPAMRSAVAQWSGAPLETRAGVCLEMLARLNRASFEMAHATMHTTGQAFMMAFQAGGPHAQDRALEAVAYAYAAMREIPDRVLWEKPQGKAEPLRIEKRFRVVPRGIGAVVASSTFPGWNSYPGIFADLITGNAVIVKPHPSAVLPLAITVEIARAALRDAGFDPNLIALVADEPSAPVAKTLIERPEITIVDYTGSSAFGEWIEAQAATKLVYTEKAGVNAVVVDSTHDFKGLARNLALSLSLYSGQMCTTPQNVFVPRAGIKTDKGPMSFDDVLGGIVGAIEGLLGAPERAVEILGAIATDATLARLEDEGGQPGVVLASRSVVHPAFADARIRTPLVVRLDAADRDRYGREQFGPIAYVVATDSTQASLELATTMARDQGAITFVVYSDDRDVLVEAERLAADAGVSVAENLTGSLLVNQSAAYSDFHVTGANPAGNASLSDAAFVVNRFRVVQTRAHAG